LSFSPLIITDQRRGTTFQISTVNGTSSDACYSANTDDFLTAFNAKAMIGLLGTVYGGNEREFIKKFWELIQTTNEGKPYTIKAAMADAVEAVKDPYFKVDQLHGVKCLGDGNLILHIPAEIAKDQTLR